MSDSIEQQINQLLEKWVDTPGQTKKAFIRLKNYIEAQKDARFDFNARPGVSYSFRASHPAQKRKLYVMADIIDDDPENRWLSVCFYGEMITDPEELGDLVPEGLLGEDGHCFDIDEWDEDTLTYVESRIDEAYHSAAKE